MGTTHEDAWNQDQDFDVREEDNETLNLRHNRGLLEYGNVGSVIANHMLRIDNKEEGNDNGHAHDDDEDSVHSIGNPDRFGLVEVDAECNQ